MSVEHRNATSSCTAFSRCSYPFLGSASCAACDIAIAVACLQTSLQRDCSLPFKQQWHELSAASPRCLVQSVFAVSVLFESPGRQFFS
jgi:hypothetical protein